MRNTILIIIFLITAHLKAQLVTYPPAPNINSRNEHIYPSPYYKVRLQQGNKIVEDFVYCMTASHTTNASKSTSWVNFSFEEKVLVTVTSLKKNVVTAKVLPRSANINVDEKTENSITFTISKPGHFSVEFEDGVYINHPLLIFANPLEDNVPDRNNPRVLFFEKGFHEIGDTNKIPDSTTVYLEGGAYVKGQFQAENASNIKITGRGILSGEDYAARTHNHMISMQNSNEIHIEGITMIHAPRYFIALRGKEHYFSNIKMMGWWFSTDGISAGENTLIENCFFKVNDDAIKLYQSNTEVRKCTIWQLENGAPFMISWNGRKNFKNIHVHDIDVIRVEHHWDNENLAVVCAVHGGEADIFNFTFENIRIDNSKWRLFHLVTRPNRWGIWNPKKGSISNLYFKNIIFYGKQSIKSLLMGHDEFHPIENVSFENLTINGNRISKLEEFIVVDSNYTKNITLK